MNQIWAVTKQAVNGWVDDDASTMGASIAYYAVFSIAPLLLISIAVAGLVWGPEVVQGAVRQQLTGLLGKTPAEAIDALLKGAAFEPGKGIVAAVTGAVLMAMGATTIFGALQGALDRIWKAPKSARPSGIIAAVRQRFLSFGMVLGIGFLMLISMVLNAVVSAFGSWIVGAAAGTDLLLQGLNEGVLLVVSTLLFAMIYKLMPSVKIAWGDVWLGAFVTAILLSVGRFAIGIYLGRGSTTSSYAAAGSVVILLLWIYYAAQIFLFGAEFTQAYSVAHGSRSRPGAGPASTASGEPEARARDSAGQRAGGPTASVVSSSTPVAGGTAIALARVAGSDMTRAVQARDALSELHTRSSATSARPQPGRSLQWIAVGLLIQAGSALLSASRRD